MEFTRPQRVIIGSVTGVAVVVVASLLVSRGCGKDKVTVIGAGEESAAATGRRSTGPVTVHVVGAVQRPGLYQLNPGARVNDAVEAAGGLVPGADSSALNLAGFLSDGQQLVIPLQSYAQTYPNAQAQTMAANPAGSVQSVYPSQEGSYPSAEQSRAAGAYPASPPPTATGGGVPPAAAGAGPAATPGVPATGGATPPAAGVASPSGSAARPRSSRSSTKAANVRFPININTASQQELDALPRVGPVLATRILQYRAQHGPFQRVEDLLNVKGIGQKTLAQMAPYVTL